MEVLYSRDELMKQLDALKSQRDQVQKNRVAVLEKYTRKATQEKKEKEVNITLYDLELQIENVERKLDSLL